MVTLMAARTLLFQKPSFNLPFSTLSKCNNIVLRFPVTKSICLDGFGLKKAKSTARRAILLKTPAFRSGDSNKTAINFQHENAFVKASTGFDSESMADADEESELELEANINDVSKWISSLALLGVLFWRSDAQSLWIAVGCTVNYIVCITLKRILNQERPVSALKSDPGMPSSHAQSIFYISWVLAISVMERVGVNAFTVTISTIALACATYFSWLRVSQRFHTLSQVVVGGAVGSIVSIMWVRLWHAFVSQAFASHLWVRSLVFSGTAIFSLCFTVDFIRYCRSQSSTQSSILNKLIFAK